MKQLAFIKRNNGSHWVGDGFPVRSIFSYTDIAEELSPFLLLDYAGPTDFPPTSRKLGVGQHPHRGFETVTIVYAGGVTHRDSSGGGGTIGPGDVQWMTAAAGLLHEEFHSEAYARKGGPFEMIQLWVNLPAKDKMTAPRYQEFSPERIPTVTPGAGVTVKVIAGEVGGVAGPISAVATDSIYLDIGLQPGAGYGHALPREHNAFLSVFEGTVLVAGTRVDRGQLAVLGQGGRVEVMAGEKPARMILVAGRPLREPVAKYGPFVMNTPQEIHQAIADYQAGKF